jgi:dTDP-4-amino-4,6-dideoxygalactose transaminase
MAGTFGELEVFSFHATKFVNAFEGGAIVTNNPELARKMRLMKNFGFLGYDNVGSIGTNGKMNELSAAMGLTSLEAMDQFIAINRRNHEVYRRALQGIPGLELLAPDPTTPSNYQYVVVEVDADHCPVSRDRLLDVLWAENVVARRYFYPGCHRMEPYKSMQPDVSRRLPQTERVSARVLVLPTGETVSPEDIARVCSIIRVAVEHAGGLMDRFDAEAAVHTDALAR